MPRSKHQTPPQVPPGPSRTSKPDKPTWRSRRAQIWAPTVDHGEEESFDIDDVSGGSDNDGKDDHDEDDDIPANNANPTIAADHGINDPELLPPKISTTADIHYFFTTDEVAQKVICVVCR